jgi:hypothetical protein
MDEPKNMVGGGSTPHTASTASPAIDIEKLAEKVYQLMREEIRLARARGNKRSARR